MKQEPKQTNAAKGAPRSGRKADKTEKIVSKPNGLAAQAAAAAGLEPAFSFGRLIRELSEDRESAILKPGRYGVRISDARVGTEANDRGLFWGVLEAEFIEHPDAETMTMFAAVNVDDSLKTEDGGVNIEDPVAKKQFLAGLKTVEKLMNLSGIDPEEIHGASDAEEVLQAFIGCEFVAVVGRGKDQNGLSCNVIKKLVKGIGDG